MKGDAPESARRDPIYAAHDEVEHLVDVAKRGESAATPAVIVGGLALFLLALVATVIAIAAVAAYLITGGAWPFS